MTELSLGWR